VRGGQGTEEIAYSLPLLGVGKIEHCDDIFQQW
jgi:hypothetical protein